jgi:hypothetical protein
MKHRLTSILLFAIATTLSPFCASAAFVASGSLSSNWWRRPISTESSATPKLQSRDRGGLDLERLRHSIITFATALLLAPLAALYRAD